MIRLDGSDLGSVHARLSSYTDSLHEEDKGKDADHDDARQEEGVVEREHRSMFQELLVDRAEASLT